MCFIYFVSNFQRIQSKTEKSGGGGVKKHKNRLLSQYVSGENSWNSFETMWVQRNSLWLLKEYSWLYAPLRLNFIHNFQFAIKTILTFAGICMRSSNQQLISVNIVWLTEIWFNTQRILRIKWLKTTKHKISMFFCSSSHNCSIKYFDV